MKLYSFSRPDLSLAVSWLVALAAAGWVAHGSPAAPAPVPPAAVAVPARFPGTPPAPEPACRKPSPGVVLEWTAMDEPVPGRIVDLELHVRARVPGSRVRVTVSVPGGVEVVGTVPALDAVVEPGDSVVLPLTVRVPAGEVRRIRAVARVGDPPGIYRTGSEILLGAQPSRRFHPREATGGGGRPLLEYDAAPRVTGDIEGSKRSPAPRPRVASSSSAGPTDVSVHGRYLYRDRTFDEDGFVHQNNADNPLLPVRRADVELLRGGQVVAAGTTDDNGAYLFIVPDEGSGQFQVRLKSRLGPTEPSLEIKFSITSPTLFSVVTSAISSPGAGSVLDFGDHVAEPSQGGEAFNILDSCLDGVDLITDLSGFPPGAPLDVFWNENSTMPTQFNRTAVRVTLFADEGYDDTVILHEFGHYVGWLYSKDDSPGGLHFIDDSAQDPRLSWSEGFASFWQSAARNAVGSDTPSWYVDTGAVSFSYDCEGPSLGVRGLASEVVVQAALWDIIDVPDTPDPYPGVDDDPLGLDLGSIWEVITGPMKTASSITLEDFWTGWFDPVVANGHEAGMRTVFSALAVELFPDVFEEDDDIAAAMPLAVNGPAAHHTFFGAGDRDHHRFELHAGDDATAETFNILGWGDTRIEVRGPDLSSLGTNDNRPSDISSSLSFTAVMSGFHYLVVERAFSGLAAHTEFGAYDVRAVRGIPNNIALQSAAGAAGVADGGFGVGAAFADYDGDGFPDLFLVNNSAGEPNDEHRDRLYRNQGTGGFAVTTESAGLGQREGGVGAAWGDFDNDGDVDLFVTDHGLFRNDGDGTFTDVTEASGVADLGREFDAAWADMDRDGDLDLFVPLRDAPSALWRNEGDGTFVNVAAGSGFGFPADGAEAYGASWGDYDGDRWPDLFVTFLGERGHALYRNLGGGQFIEVTGAAGLASALPAVGSLWADLDNDGDLDLYVCRSSENLFYRNQGDGTFLEDGAGWGINDAGASRGAGVADYDLDGDLDLYVVNFNGVNSLYENLGQNMLRSTQGGVNGLGHSCAWADYDADGDPDLYLPVQSGNNILFRNQLNDGGGGRPWLAVELRGAVSNAGGVGAWIRVFTGDGGVQLREVGTGNGWASQSRVPERFGFADGASVDSIRVDWPSGAFNVAAAPALGETILILEDTRTPVLPAPDPVPFALVVGPAFPNPFVGATSVRFSLTASARVTVTVFDLQGRPVRTLVDRSLEAGDHVAGWDGTDAWGRSTPPGVYFYRARTSRPGDGVRENVRKLVRLAD